MDGNAGEAGKHVSVPRGVEDEQTAYHPCRRCEGRRTLAKFLRTSVCALEFGAMRLSAPRALPAPRAPLRSLATRPSPARAAGSAPQPRLLAITAVPARAFAPAAPRHTPHHAVTMRTLVRRAAQTYMPSRALATAPSGQSETGAPSEPANAAEDKEKKTAKKTKAKKAEAKEIERPLPPGTSMVVNLQDKRIEDAALGVRTFIITSVEAAQRFPVQVEAPLWPTENDGRCSKCRSVVSPCVVTTFPTGESGPAAEAQARVRLPPCASYVAESFG